MLEHSPQVDQADRHHREIGHHVALPEKPAQGFREGHQLCGNASRLRVGVGELAIGPVGGLIPVPIIFKCLNLRFGVGSVGFLKRHIVAAR